MNSNTRFILVGICGDDINNFFILRDNIFNIQSFEYIIGGHIIFKEMNNREMNLLRNVGRSLSPRSRQHMIVDLHHINNSEIIKIIRDYKLSILTEL